MSGYLFPGSNPWGFTMNVWISVPVGEGIHISSAGRMSTLSCSALLNAVAGLRLSPVTPALQSSRGSPTDRRMR